MGVSVQPIVADQRVFHTTQYPSQIVLPIIPKGSLEESHAQ